MAVISEGTLTTAPLYKGLAADVKPVAPAGSRFIETDTGSEYLYSGTAWYKDRHKGVPLICDTYSFVKLAADGQVKAGAGNLHTLTFTCNDAAPTAGSIIVYDSLSETGTEIYNETFTTTPFRGYSVILDVAFATGLYVGFTTTGDVNVTVSYR